jgi:hypothetical protein
VRQPRLNLPLQFAFDLFVGGFRAHTAFA